MEAADCDYRTALPAVLEEDPELKRAYALTERHGLGNRLNVATIMSLADKNLKAVALKLHSQVYQDLDFACIYMCEGKSRQSAVFTAYSILILYIRLQAASGYPDGLSSPPEGPMSRKMMADL